MGLVLLCLASPELVNSFDLLLLPWFRRSVPVEVKGRFLRGDVFPSLKVDELFCNPFLLSQGFTVFPTASFSLAVGAAADLGRELW